MKFTAKISAAPDRVLLQAAAQYRKDLRAAAIEATDRASKEAQRGVQERITASGLGRLSRAVGHTSTKRERSPGDPYGVLYARGGDESLAGGALESYSRGSTIRPGPGHQWLAFPTAAVPRFVSVGGRRRRLTVDLYLKSGLMQSIGKLIFRQISASRAVWIIRRASVSPKTGRAKAVGPGKTRTRILQKDVVAFVGIRVTRRAARFNKDGVVSFYAKRVPRYMTEALAARAGSKA